MEEENKNNKKISEEQILNSLREIIDPELDIDIVTLGLIRNVETGVWAEDFNMYESLKVTMTLTSPMCPFADSIIEQVETRLQAINNGEGEVELSFDPPWEPSEEIKMLLNI